MIKNFIKTIIFIILLILFLNRIYGVLAWKDTAGSYYSSFESFYDLKDDLVDVVFLGSSHTYCGVNNSILWEDQGIASFSMAISGQDFTGSYYSLKEVLKTQTPEIVCLEVYGSVFHGYTVESNMYRNTLSYRLSRNAIDAITNIAEDRKMELLFKWPIIHTRYAELQKEDFLRKDSVYIGYHSEFIINPIDGLYTNSYITEIERIGEENEFWLRKIIELTREKGIELVFFATPYVCSEVEQKKLNYIEQISKEEEIPFVNMWKEVDGLVFDPNQDFIDSGHMNYYGAEKISHYLASYLKENYSIKDRRKSKQYELWAKDASFRKHEILNKTLQDTNDLESYMNWLTKLDDYTIIVVSNNGYYFSQAGIDGYMKEMGIDQFTDMNCIYIKNRNVVRVETTNSDFFDYMDLPGASLSISSSAENTGIVLDLQSYAKTQNGINILVYDNLLKTVVDSIGIEADNSFDIIK